MSVLSILALLFFLAFLALGIAVMVGIPICAVVTIAVSAWKKTHS